MSIQCYNDAGAIIQAQSCQLRVDGNNDRTPGPTDLGPSDSVNAVVFIDYNDDYGTEYFGGFEVYSTCSSDLCNYDSGTGLPQWYTWEDQLAPQQYVDGLVDVMVTSKQAATDETHGELWAVGGEVMFGWTDFSMQRTVDDQKRVVNALQLAGFEVVSSSIVDAFPGVSLYADDMLRGIYAVIRLPDVTFSPTTAPTTAPETVAPTVSLVGKIFTGFRLSSSGIVASADVCQQHCDASPLCAGSTYYVRSSWCNLYADAGKTRSAKNAVVSAFSAHQCGDVIRRRRFDSSSAGNSVLSRVQTVDESECCATCTATSGCVGFSYKYKNKRCMLMGQADGTLAITRAFSVSARVLN